MKDHYLFKEYCKSRNINFDSTDLVRWEEIYQVFKQRLIEELLVDSPELQVRGRLIDRG